MSTGNPQEVQETEAQDLGPNFIEEYGKQIAFGAISLVILFAVAAFVANSGRTGAEKSWSKFAAAESATDFANVASDCPDTDVAIWARLTEGEMLLRMQVQHFPAKSLHEEVALFAVPVPIRFGYADSLPSQQVHYPLAKLDLRLP